MAWPEDLYWRNYSQYMPSVLWRCWLGDRKGIRPVKNWVVGCWRGYFSGSMAQLMPLPLTVSCFSKIQIGFTFLVLAHMGDPGKRAVKRVCVCVCFWYRLTRVVPDKGPLNVCVCVNYSHYSASWFRSLVWQQKNIEHEIQQQRLHSIRLVSPEQVISFSIRRRQRYVWQCRYD